MPNQPADDILDTINDLSKHITQTRALMLALCHEGNLQEIKSSCLCDLMVLAFDQLTLIKQHAASVSDCVLKNRNNNVSRESRRRVGYCYSVRLDYSIDRVRRVTGTELIETSHSIA